MAKETAFGHPPRGHVALLAYDPAEDRFRVLEVESDANPNLLVSLAGGSVEAHVGAPNADNLSGGTPGLFVVGHLYGYDGATWDRLRATAGQLQVAQATASSLRAQVDNCPRIPAGVTNLSGTYQAIIASGSFVELLSNTNATTLAGLSGRTVANGKRLCVAWQSAQIGVTTGQVWAIIAFTNVIVNQIAAVCPTALFAPSVIYYAVGDGVKIWKVVGFNYSGSSQNTIISALCWEEDVF